MSCKWLKGLPGCLPHHHHVLDHRGGRPQVQPHGSHKPVSDSTGFIIGFAKNAWSSVKTGIRKAKKLAESNSSPTKIGKKFRQYTISIQSVYNRCASLIYIPQSKFDISQDPLGSHKYLHINWYLTFMIWHLKLYTSLIQSPKISTTKITYHENQEFCDK